MVGIILFVCLFVCGFFFVGLNIKLLFRTNKPKTNIQRPHIFVSIILLIYSIIGVLSPRANEDLKDSTYLF